MEEVKYGDLEVENRDEICEKAASAQNAVNSTLRSNELAYKHLSAEMKRAVQWVWTADQARDVLRNKMREMNKEVNVERNKARIEAQLAEEAAAQKEQEEDGDSDAEDTKTPAATTAAVKTPTAGMNPALLKHLEELKKTDPVTAAALSASLGMDAGATEQSPSPEQLPPAQRVNRGQAPAAANSKGKAAAAVGSKEKTVPAAAGNRRKIAPDAAGNTAAGSSHAAGGTAATAAVTDCDGATLETGDRVAFIVKAGTKSLVAAYGKMTDTNVGRKAAVWDAVAGVKVRPGLVLVKEVSIADKQQAAAKSVFFSQDHLDKGIRRTRNDRQVMEGYHGQLCVRCVRACLKPLTWQWMG